jgi:hypothetical protein
VQGSEEIADMRKVLGAVLLFLHLLVLASCGVPGEPPCDALVVCPQLDAGTDADADASDEDAPDDGGDPGDANADPDANADGG